MAMFEDELVNVIISMARLAAHNEFKRIGGDRRIYGILIACASRTLFLYIEAGI